MSSEQTIERLVATATEEFRRYGYNGTDVNRIARRSGMAPTTFYRVFKDKLDVFIAVYQDWVEREKSMLRVLMTLNAPDADLVSTCIGHHRDHLPFRRSLRQLAYEEVRVRHARAQTRLETINDIRVWRGQPEGDDAQTASDLIQFERLADALAEGEFADMGLDEGQALGAELAAILRAVSTTTANLERSRPVARLARCVVVLNIGARRPARLGDRRFCSEQTGGVLPAMLESAPTDPQSRHPRRTRPRTGVGKFLGALQAVPVETLRPPRWSRR